MKIIIITESQSAQERFQRVKISNTEERLQLRLTVTNNGKKYFFLMFWNLEGSLGSGTQSSTPVYSPGAKSYMY